MRQKWGHAKIVIPKEDSETDDANDMVEIDSRSILGIGSTTFLGFLWVAILMIVN